MESASIIIKNFYIPNLNLNYYVGINQIYLNFESFLKKMNFQKEKALNFIFNLSEDLQNKYKDSTVQFFSHDYIINQDHIFNASYFTQKAFLQNLNISNRRNIELMLYLTTKRQIKIAFKAFGINIKELEKNILTYCIISNERNIVDIIDKEIIQILNANKITLILNEFNEDKFKRIKSFFEFNDNQLNVILHSYDFKKLSKDSPKYCFDELILALNDLLCEKMALLSLEKIKIS
jgi:tRNA threonylcarbamoyladenosine modification (KEOPS) complex Cgi121 subunit